VCDLRQIHNYLSNSKSSLENKLTKYNQIITYKTTTTTIIIMFPKGKSPKLRNLEFLTAY
jgi:hypothetical protein